MCFDLILYLLQYTFCMPTGKALIDVQKSLCLCWLPWKQVPFSTPDRWQAKTLLTTDECDQKSLETVFSIAICRQSGDKWEWKTLFLTIFDLSSLIVLTFSIVANPVSYLMWEFRMSFALINKCSKSIVLWNGCCFIATS